MTLNEYQELAMTTCMQSCANFSYMFLNLVSEVGEFSGKIAKAIRKEEAIIDYNHLATEHGLKIMSDSDIHELQQEAGDILWQLSGLCEVMGWNLEDIAQLNLHKLADRKRRGVINGSGDNR